MKKKFFLVTLLGIMLMIGMVLVSCAETCHDSIVGAACKLSWTNNLRDSGSMLCAQKSCNVNKNWNKTGTSASCNC